MAYPDLQPTSLISKSILPPTGTLANVTTATVPFGVYLNSDYWTTDQIDLFKQGAVEEVAYVYKKLGGDVLDIELVETQVYAAYEEACLEYSYLINLYHGKGSLSRLLGSSTKTFNNDGQISGSSEHIELKYPKYTLGFANRVAQGFSGKAGMNGTDTVYSASYEVKAGVQDYDLQNIISASAAQSGKTYSGVVGNKRINITKVHYKTTAASWNFYGYFGGLNVVGNLSTYGQYADDSTFEIIPVWQNKLQAMAYEDAIKTRVSDYSYQLRDNKIRIFPTPSTSSPTYFWVEFTVPEDAWSSESGAGSQDGSNGINNLNTLPFQNLPYDSINSIGKQWIRRFALSLCKEMLGYIRNKFSSIPIPGETIQLNGTALVTEAKAEQKDLREELSKILDDTTYDKLSEKDAATAKSVSEIQSYVPNLIFVG
jgi:hypothetical protein